VIGIPHARDALGHTEATCGQSREYVGGVIVGNGKEQVGVVDPMLLQDPGVTTIARNRHDVQLALQVLRFFQIGFHNDDLMALLSQGARDVKTDFSGTDDKDLHERDILTRTRHFCPVRFFKMPRRTALFNRPEGPFPLLYSLHRNVP
jgi:hypothetical protein